MIDMFLFISAFVLGRTIAKWIQRMFNDVPIITSNMTIFSNSLLHKSMHVPKSKREGEDRTFRQNWAFDIEEIFIIAFMF